MKKAEKKLKKKEKKQKEKKEKKEKKSEPEPEFYIPLEEREKASVPCELAAAASARSASVKIAPP